MRGKILFLLSVGAWSIWGNLPAGAAGNTVACVEQGKKLFADKETAQAKAVFAQCAKENPSNVEVLLSLAGAELTLENLEDAEKHFQLALSKMNRTSPYVSYTYSMLGDIALKKQQNEFALAYYGKSLESNAANVNSLVGKGVITEYQGDKEGAAEFYRAALAVEPLNVIARQRLINLEPEYFTDDEILNALKQRYAIAPNAEKINEEQRQLFVDIHSVEQRKGVEYLKNKYLKVPPEYVVTLNKGTAFERDILTLQGYNTLSKLIGQDAISVFQRLGVPIQSVFALRDMKGEKIFKADSTLTKSGFAVYTEALKNHKTFLLPEEDVPPTSEKLKKIERRVEELKEQGYVQISTSEKKKIEKETFCAEEWLRKEYGLVVVPVTKRKRYYFVAPNDPKNSKKSVSYYYVMKNRSKKNPSIQVPRNVTVENYQFYDYTICAESDGKPI